MKENHLYGSARLGVDNRDAALYDNTKSGASRVWNPFYPQGTDGGWFDTQYGSEEPPFIAQIGEISSFTRGLKAYEISNHLGNVLVTVSDKKFGYGVDNTGILTMDPTDENSYFQPEILSAQDYYAYGATKPGRRGSLKKNAEGNIAFVFDEAADINNWRPIFNYRYAFNGKEADKKIWSEDRTSYDFGYRILDGPQFTSPDPLVSKYPSHSPYVSFGNNPIAFIDTDGRENVIYLVVTQQARAALPVGAAENIARQANQAFENLGLNTRVAVVQNDNNNNRGNNVFVNNPDLHVSDRVAIIGANVNETLNFAASIHPTNVARNRALIRNGNVDDRWDGGFRNPERSTTTLNDRPDMNRHVIYIDAGGLVAAPPRAPEVNAGDHFFQAGETPESVAAFLIVHGTGHNAGLMHRNPPGIPNPDGFMNSGGYFEREKDAGHPIRTQDALTFMFQNKAANVGAIQRLERSGGNVDGAVRVRNRPGVNPPAPQGIIPPNNNQPGGNNR